MPRRIEVINRRRGDRIFNAWISGKSYEECAAISGAGLPNVLPIPVDQVRLLISNYIQTLRYAHRKWKLAEARCHALGMELRLLRVGREAAPDRPIESLSPPKQWLSAYKRAGIETVNQLRSVDSDILLSGPPFPSAAIDWAVMKLDLLGLSHALVRPKHIRIQPRLGKRVDR